MPAIRNALGTFVTSATATGLTGLDNASKLLTWSAWLRMDPSKMGSGQSSVWCHADDQWSPRNGAGVFVFHTGELRLRPWTASQQAVQSPHGLVDGRWAHFVIRKDANAVTFFRNRRNVLRVANTISMTVSGTRRTQVGLTIGGVQSLAGVEVWDIRVFPGIALSDAECALLADPRSQVAGCKQRLFWQRNWRAIGSGAITLPDESGNGNNLTTSATTLVADPMPEPDWYRILRDRKVFGRVAAGGTLYLQSLAASMTPSGTIVKRTADTLAASVTAAGAVVKRTADTVAASITAAGAVVKRTADTVMASLTAMATVTSIKAALLTLSASVTASGALVRRVASTMAASLTAAGAVVKRTADTVTASLTATGAVVKRMADTVTASLTATATIATIKVALRSVTASLTATATLVQRTSRTLAASVTSTADVLKRIPSQLAASITAAGTVTRTRAQALAASLTAAAAVVTAFIRGALASRGKYAAEHRSAKSDIADATTFTNEHTSAVRDLGDAGL